MELQLDVSPSRVQIPIAGTGVGTVSRRCRTSEEREMTMGHCGGSPERLHGAFTQQNASATL